MSTTTNYYAFTKPELSDPADIRAINGNMDTLDTILHGSQVSLADAFDQTKAYSAGDVVMYQFYMYKFTEDKAAGNWDATKVERTTAAETGGGEVDFDLFGEASGNPASFADGASAELVKCIAEIVPKQAGSGTPSPDNVRAISGSTSVTVTISDGETSTTKTTALGQTVYGGQLNVLTGELTIDRVAVDMGSLEWSYNSTYQRFGAVISDMKPAETNGTPLEGVICSAYATGSANNTANSSYNGYIGVSTTSTLYARNENYTDATTFTSVVSGQTVVYPLATPQTVQLTPQEVNSLLGQNNISADTGDVDIVYVKSTAPIKPNPSGEADGYLSSIELGGEKFEIIKELPTFPTSDGDYKLKLSVSSGAPTLSWESDT